MPSFKVESLAKRGVVNALSVLVIAWMAPAQVLAQKNLPSPTGHEVIITSPVSGSTVSGTTPVTANVSKLGGGLTVAGIQFKLDGANLGSEDKTAPYSVPWDTIRTSNGSHTLTAVARLANSSTRGGIHRVLFISDPLTVTVFNDTTAPTVTITSPTAGATVSGTITVSATAADSISVAGVQFFLDGALLGAEDASSPYSVSWHTLATANGLHTLTAKARDAAGNVTTSTAVTVTVSNAIPDTTPPVVTVESPPSGATVSGTITVTASALDNIGVAGVQFFLDGAPLGAEDTISPHSVSWDTLATANGLHTLTARARDAAGNVATSSPVSVTVSNVVADTTSPIVTLESPPSGATVSGTITVSASASDNVGVAGVQFFLDGAPLGAEDTLSPYAISWDTLSTANSSYTLTAQARDAAGNLATSLPVIVAVSNGTSDLPPTVAIESPTPGATVFGTIAVRAAATDDVGVVGVQFFLDGAPLGVEDTSSPYAAGWDTLTFANGSYTLTAQARDTAGNFATSSPITVTVSNDTTPPTVAINSPSPGATVSGTVTVSATAADNVGVGGVQFFLDGAPLGVEDTTAPYSISWDTTLFSNSSRTLTAQARDAAGNRATSTAVTVTVSNDAPPPECARPLNAFPGTTTFNNAVRAQMWIVNGTWWGAFADGTTGIYFYTLSGNSFIKGALIDANFAVGEPETLWNGSELFILVYKSGSLATLYKYNFVSGSFVLFPGFPVDLPLAGLATATALAQDSTGKLWATYTSSSNAHVIWSTSADHLTWNTTGIVLEDNLTTLTTEASTIVHFGGDKIGVAWGNQAFAEYAFRFHRDGDPESSWSARELIDCCNPAGPAADDHLSLRAAPDGRLFLVAKDSVGFGNLHLFIRSTSGEWSPRSKINSNPTAQPTRPGLTLDVENQNAYVVYHNSTDKQLYAAHTAMSSTAFVECVFLTGGNNVTTTKQNVNSTTGLVAAASVGGQILAGLITLGSTSASVASQAESMSFAVAESAPATVAPMNETPAGDFEFIWKGRLSTSRAPADHSQWRWLRGQGVNTIVHLDDAMLDFGQFGFESFLWVPLRAGEPPTDEQAQNLLKFIQLSDNQPAHLSGTAADGRGLMVALLRYAVDGLSIDAALAEGARHTGLGLSLSARQVGWMRGWARAHRPGSHRLK